MESGSGEERKRKKMGESTKETVSRIKERECYYQRRSRGQNEAFICTIHDNTSPAYAWLLPGWVAQERHMISGRVYRYYYDPTGRAYRSQSEVVAAWEALGVVVIDN